MTASRSWRELGRYAVIVLAAVFALIPIVWMATLAFKPILEWNVAAAEIAWLPKHPTFANFEFIFSAGRTATGPIFASLVLATLGTLVAGVVGSCAAYAVSRFKLLAPIGLVVLVLRLVPPLVIIVPVMVLWTYLDLIDTWLGMALIYGIINVPFSFWLMKTFFDEIPIEIEEAAMVEGCGHWRAFYRVTLPLVKVPLATTGLFVFILCWSDYTFALFLTSDDWITIPVFMNSLANYGPRAALGLIALVPPMIFGLIIQRHLARGVTFGALQQ
jgi:multiple sugar transport system permease protein